MNNRIEKLKQRLAIASRHTFPSQLYEISSQIPAFALRRDDLVKELTSMLTSFEEVEADLTDGDFKRVHDYIESMLGTLENSLSIVASAMNQFAPSDPALREATQTAIGKLETVMRNLVDRAIAIDSLLVSYSNRRRIKALSIESVSQLKAELEERISQLAKGATVIEQAAGIVTYDRALRLFDDRAVEHERGEEKWRVYLLWSLSFLIVFVCFILTSQPSSNAAAAIASYVTKNLLLILTGSFMVGVALRRWNLERALTILYRHRSAALQLYHVFNETIASDPEARRNLQLEMVKLLFQDPQTGLTDRERGEVPVTPIMNVIGRVADRIQPPKSS